MRFQQLFVGVFALSAAACGGEPSGVATADDIATYGALAVQVESATDTYRSTMAGGNVMTVGDCLDVHDAYDAEVRPWVAQMMDMAHRMDGFMDDHGGYAQADMACVAARMADELDHHDSVACGLGDLAQDRVEAQRHADAMGAYANHVQDRCNEMMMNGAGGWHFGPMMDGCQSWDGCCSDAMFDCCGGMMHGGMMHGSGPASDGGMCCP